MQAALLAHNHLRRSTNLPLLNGRKDKDSISAKLLIERIDRAAEIATKNPYANPRPVSRDGIRQLLQQAYEGHCPA